MLAVTQVPRGSNGDNENFRHKKILSFLKQQAEELNCQTYVDKGDNLIIHKPAYPGICFLDRLRNRTREQAGSVSAVPYGYGGSEE